MILIAIIHGIYNLPKQEVNTYLCFWHYEPNQPAFFRKYYYLLMYQCTIKWLKHQNLFVCFIVQTKNLSAPDAYIEAFDSLYLPGHNY